MAEVKRTDPIAGDVVHEYDGIEEADNELPIWWVSVFLGSIVFACVYWLVYAEYHSMPSPSEELVAELAQRQIAQQNAVVGDDELLAKAKDASAAEAGRQVFATTCVACHGPNGEGNIGPNLTDTQWLHGGAPSAIFITIRDGVPSKGMPTWGPMLGKDKVEQVAAYLLTLRNRNLPGKAPQGDVYSGL
jgi:cytochrome c oxidase cbb3-type subunit 3